MPVISVKDLTFAYDSLPEREVLRGVSFKLGSGTITAFIGLSGCGKSTLCQVLCGIIPACISGRLEGEVRLRGDLISQTPLRELSQKIGYVMQDPDRQMISQTVEDELAFGLENVMTPPAEIRRRVDQTMNLLGISHLALKNPVELSGGQKQLVAAGAVMSLEPSVVIMDEPLSHLDEKGKTLVRGAIQSLKNAGKTVILVEHDYMLVDFADQWVIMEDGKIKAIARPETFLTKEEIL